MNDYRVDCVGVPEPVFFRGYIIQPLMGNYYSPSKLWVYPATDTICPVGMYANDMDEAVEIVRHSTRTDNRRSQNDI